MVCQESSKIARIGIKTKRKGRVRNSREISLKLNSN
jgi:hypothetical protein